MKTTKKIGVLVSGRGSNLQALIDAISNGRLSAEIAVVISDNSKALALEKSESAGIPNFSVSKKHRDTEILKYLEQYQVDVVVLAGFLKKIGNNILEKYKGKIINIHPALLPKFGGPGMFGINVHRAVIEAGEKTTGATVHLVTENYDEGPILAQIKVPVEENDTPETLAARVIKSEHIILVDSLQKFLSTI